MAKSPAEDIATLLQTNSFGTLGTDLFVNGSPDPPDNSVEVNDSGGVYPVDAMGSSSSKPMFERPGIQVKVRNNSNSTAAEKIYDIFVLLHGYAGTIGDMEYLFIEASQSPFKLFKDENERSVYVCNFLLNRRSV